MLSCLDCANAGTGTLHPMIDFPMTDIQFHLLLYIALHGISLKIQRMEYWRKTAIKLMLQSLDGSVRVFSKIFLGDTHPGKMVASRQNRGQKDPCIESFTCFRKKEISVQAKLCLFQSTHEEWISILWYLNIDYTLNMFIDTGSYLNDHSPKRTCGSW